MKTNSKLYSLSGTRADGKILCYANEDLGAVVTINASSFSGVVPTEVTVTVLGYFAEAKPAKVIDPVKLASSIEKTKLRLSKLEALAPKA